MYYIGESYISTILAIFQMSAHVNFQNSPYCFYMRS